MRQIFHQLIFGINKVEIMRLWTVLIGGAAGLAMGGPLGALLGALAGHVLAISNEYTGSAPPPNQHRREQIAFTTGVIALAAKMAKADGAVSPAEIKAFQEVFAVPPHAEADVARVFDLARQTSTGFEHYARQLAQIFANRPLILQEILNCLIYIARADHQIHPDELRYLQSVCDIFGIRHDYLNQLIDSQQPKQPDPYAVLGVSRESDLESVKRAWREKIKDHHPDMMIAQQRSDKEIKEAAETTRKLNEAWQKIKSTHPEGKDQ